MRIVTTAQMKQIEKNADCSGLSYLQMMENAGAAAYQAVRAKYPALSSMTVVAGKGNNGGDGFVIARLAAKDGIAVHVILAEGQPVTADAKTNFDRLSGLPIDITCIEETDDISSVDVVIDALYGTGFHGALRSFGIKACQLMMRSRASIVSLDLPSGTHADTGTVSDGAVRAALTVAFDSYKQVHTAVQSASYCGEIILADIGIPQHCREFIH